MALVAGVDSSTQSCKVTIRDADTGAVVRGGARPTRTARPSTPVTGGTPSAPRSPTPAASTTSVPSRSPAAARHGRARRRRPRGPRRAALERRPQCGRRRADGRGARPGGMGRPHGTGPGRVVHRHQAALAPRRGSRQRGPRRRRGAPHDWLSWRLRGYGPADESPLGPDLDALATDASDASGTAYWDPVRREYDPSCSSSRSGVACGSPVPTARRGRRGRGAAGRRARRGDGLPRGRRALPGGVTAPSGLVVGAGLGDNAGQRSASGSARVTSRCPSARAAPSSA